MAAGGRRVETAGEIERALADRALIGCVVRRVDLCALSMDGVKVDDVEFVEVGLAGASLMGLRARNSQWSGAAMRGSRWSQARLDDVTFRGCQAVEASFRGADLLGVRFEECPLDNADFEGATLVAPVFVGSSLYNARFARAVLVRPRFENRRLGNAVLSRADFTGAVLVDADLRGADLGGARFRDALLVRTRMDDANLSGADFTGARMVDGTAARASLDDGAREGLRAAVVAREDREFKILAFLAGGGDRLVPLVHGLMLAYVLGREPSPDPAIPVADPDPVPETVPGRAVADERKPLAAAPPVESHEPYERIKKIELD